MMNPWMRKAVVMLGAAGLAGIALAGCARTTTVTSGPTSSDGSRAASPGVSADDQLPANWPSDVPVPSLPVKKAVAVNLPSGPTFTAIFHGQGDPGATLTSLNDQFAKAGFTSRSSFGSGSSGGIAAWHKGNLTVQVTVTTEGGELIVSETVVTTPNAS